jgi:tetratricopeptide (TPR) repeat protein
MKKGLFIFFIVMLMASMGISAYGEENENTAANSNEQKYPDLYEAYKKLNISDYNGEITSIDNVEILENEVTNNVNTKTTILLDENNMEIVFDKQDDCSDNPSTRKVHYILADGKLYFNENDGSWIKVKTTTKEDLKKEDLEKEFLDINETINIFLEGFNLLNNISVNKITVEDKVYTEYTIDYKNIDSQLLFQSITGNIGLKKSDIENYILEAVIDENNELIKETTIFETKKMEKGRLKISREMTSNKKNVLIKAPVCDPIACANFYNEYGYKLHSDGRYEDAIKYYNYAIEFDPEHDSAYNNIGWALIELGRPEEALPYIDKSIEIDPIDAAAPYNNKGNALKNLERYDEALKCYDKALAIDPEVSFAYYGKGITYLALKKYDKALENFKKNLELVPNDIDAYFYIADILFEQKKYNEAIENYDKIIMINPDIEIAYLNKADALFMLKEYTMSISNYDKCIKLYPDAAEAYAGKSRCYAMLKNHDETVANLKIAISLDESYLDLALADDVFIGIIGPKEFDELTGE